MNKQCTEQPVPQLPLNQCKTKAYAVRQKTQKHGKEMFLYTMG